METGGGLDRELIVRSLGIAVLQALEILEEEQETQWKEWEAFQVMLKLGASCESTYGAVTSQCDGALKRK